jgi:heavy metal efflux system protein
MVSRIIEFSVKNKFLIGLFTFGLVAWGIWSLARLPVDAVPDITNNQVQVISIAPTLATQEVEQYISAPIEVAMATIPDVLELRSISRLGLSVVTIVFEDHVDIYKARQMIGERLKEAEANIPEGVTHPEMAPVSTGLGEIYQYLIRLKPGYESKYTSADLRTFQDWIVKRELLGTPGVAEVNSYGGFVKEYEVAVNPERLRGMGVTLPEILDALEKNNENTGSAYIEKNPKSYFIRGIGLAASLEDVGQIVVKVNPDHVPVLIRDVATVQFGHAIRYGAFVCDTSEAVGGVVMMLKGANASRVVKDVKDRMAVISESLPEGVYIEPYLDRTDLVERAIGTVTKNLVEGGLIVIFVLVLMLGNMRAGLIVASVIPLAMLFAISMMNLFGISGNLMSLGAIDFGLIVDGAVIIVENVVHRLTKLKKLQSGNTRLTRDQMNEEVTGSAKRMMSSATFGQFIILIVYLPILTLVGIEGKMFRPMAETVGFAILGALILSLTYVPMISALALGRKTEVRRNISDMIMDFLRKGFDPLFNYALYHKKIVLSFALVITVAGLLLFTRLGGEFIPTLEEGDLASGIMTLQGGSLTNTVETVKKANKILKENFPEVKLAVCKVGAGEIPTDPTPVETGDYIITMKEKKEWTSATTREEMVEKMKEKVGAIPGVDFSFQQPISMRFNELMTGSKQDLAVKIFGNNLDSLAHEAEQLELLIRQVTGVEDIQVEKVTGAQQISVVYNRARIAQYGLNIADLNKILRAAFAGYAAGVIFEEEKRFDLVVRFESGFRQDIENVRQLYIPLPDGRQVPLTEVAAVTMKTGTAQVSREDAKRRITVSFNVRNRDVRSIIDDIKLTVAKNLKLPPGYYITYGGQFQNLVAAQNRLAVAVPVALLLIFVLLFFTFGSVRQTLLISSALPLAAVGGVFALWIRGMNFSISAGVGFIALFGVAVLNGIVLIAEFNRLEKEEGITDIYERVLKGLHIRLRPVLMTAAVASLGFLPMAISTSAGAEVQKPLATVVIGGLITATLLTLVVLPVLYIIFTRKEKRKDKTMGSKVIATVLLMVLPALMMAQTPGVKVYTLEAAIQQALSANATVRSAGLEIENRRALRESSWDIGKTRAEFNYGQFNSASNDNLFTVSQDLAFPLTYAKQHQAANAAMHGAELDARVARTAVVSQVKSAYFELSFCHARLNLLLFKDSLFGNFNRAAKLRYESGEINLLEKLNAESELMAVRNEILQATADIRILTCRLQTLLNEKEDIAIADTVLKKLTIFIPADTAALAGNPMLASLEQQVRLARINRQVEASKLLPDLSIGYFNQSNKEIDPGARYDGIQGGITVPLFFNTQKGRISSAKISEDKAQTEYEYGENALHHRLHILTEEYMKYNESLQYYENAALEQADQIILQANRSYKAGEIGYLEFIQNLRQGLEIRNGYLETLNAYNQSVIAIEELISKQQ